MLHKSILGLSAALLLFNGLLAPAQADEKQVTVSLSYIVDHPAIEATKVGILEVLAAAGYIEGKTMALEVQSAQGNMTTQTQIAQKFAGDRPDLIIAISTPSAQASMAASSDIPIIFAAVTNPLAAGLVDSNEVPGRNLAGSSARSPVDKHLALIKDLVPGVKTVGVIYNAGEANSVSEIEDLKIEAEKAGLNIVEASAAQSAAVIDAARSLVGRVDVIYVPTDSTVVSAIEAVVRVGQDADIPVIAADTGSVERGAIAALGFDYTDVGRVAGEIAVRVLKGENPANIPVGSVDKLELYLNPGSAVEMGLTIPASVLANATKIVE